MTGMCWNLGINQMLLKVGSFSDMRSSSRSYETVMATGSGVSFSANLRMEGRAGC